MQNRINDIDDEIAWLEERNEIIDNEGVSGELADAKKI